MGYTNAYNPITIDESVPDWCAGSISREANLRMPDAFQTVPTFETLTFRHRESFGPTVIANWPKEASQVVLALGTYDFPSSGLKPLVYMFVHGQKNHHIGYFYINPDLSIKRMQQSGLYYVEIEEPFCDLGDRSLRETTVYNRIRAVSLYYFLAAGYIDEIGNYSHFWSDFTKACTWIANKGNCPKQHAKSSKREKKTVPASAAIPIPDPKETESTLDSVLSKKRTNIEEPERRSTRIKRRDYSHTMEPSQPITPRSASPQHPVMAISVEAELPNSEIANAQLRAEMEAQAISLGKSQAQVTSLTAEVKQARSEAMYTQNAYRGIELQCKDLVAQRDNAINDGKGLRGQLSQSQARCTQFEKRLKVLETELERLRQMMRSAREALDGSAL